MDIEIEIPTQPARQRMEPLKIDDKRNDVVMQLNSASAVAVFVALSYTSSYHDAVAQYLGEMGQAELVERVGGALVEEGVMSREDTQTLFRAVEAFGDSPAFTAVFDELLGRNSDG
jgi:hypothetical protein